MSGAVLVTAILAAVLLACNDDPYPWLRAAVGVIGVGAAALLLVVARLDRPMVLARPWRRPSPLCLAGLALPRSPPAAGPH